MVRNLRKDVDKSIDVINTLRGANAELVTQNADIAKTLGKKEKVILKLEKALNERREAMSKGADGIQKNFKLLFEKYSEALGQFGTRPNPFPENEDASVVMDWMLTEFKALPEVISGASDFAAVFSVESLLKLLENYDCVDLEKFRGAIQQFPDASSTSLIRANEDVRAVKVKFMKEFWIASGREFAKKTARDKLEEVAIS